ncbi:MAG: hypothetical protein SFV53_00040 [Rickettsiales bacterium]|nr:hypothetical protein [Rickettsiales bacterium]
MSKNVKKLLKILLATIALLVIGYIVIVGWIGVTVLGPALERSNIIEKLENESYKVAILVDCKEMLKAENAWNPTVNYNYAYYLRKKHCPAPEELKNVEEIQKEFCGRVLKEDPSLHNLYVTREKICPPIEADHHHTQEN